MNLLFTQNLTAKKICSAFFALTVILSSATPLFLAGSKEATAQYATATEEIPGLLTTLIEAAIVELEAITQATESSFVEMLTEWSITELFQQAIKFLTEDLWTKEFIYDTIVWVLVHGLIPAMTASVVNWINSGFNGTPNYVLDKSTLLGMVVDENTARLIQEVAALAGSEDIYPQFQEAIIQAVVGGFQQGFHLKSTFPGGWQAYDNYRRDYRTCISRSSWDCYLSLSYWGNSPYGVSSYVLRELHGRIAEKVANVTNDLIESTGFLSLTECTKEIKQLNNDNTPRDEDGDGKQDVVCGESRKITPGHAVANQLDWFLTTNLRSMELADEIGESIAAILDALLNQLIEQGVYALTSGDDPNKPGSSFGYPKDTAVDRWCFTYSTTAPNAPVTTVCQANQEECDTVRNARINNPPPEASVTSCRVEGSGPVAPPPVADTTKPTIRFLVPTNGETVHGTVGIKVDVQDADTVLRVVFRIDGERRFIDTRVPYLWNWDTTKFSNGLSLPNGPHTITVRASDRAGNFRVASITVTVNNLPDAGKPQCSDNFDNDNDLYADKVDPGCHAGGLITGPYLPDDNNEVDVPEYPQCSDTVDNDNANGADAADPQCHFGGNASYPWDPSHDDEATNAPLWECANAPTDDDGDGLVDALDPGCHTDATLGSPYDQTIDDESKA